MILCLEINLAKLTFSSKSTRKSHVKIKNVLFNVSDNFCVVHCYGASIVIFSIKLSLCRHFCDICRKVCHVYRKLENCNKIS